MTDKLFVQVGLRRKGRIFKNEQFSVKEFVNKVTPTYEESLESAHEHLSFFERLNSKNVLRTQEDAYITGYGQALVNLNKEIEQLVASDEFGRKNKKRSTKNIKRI